MKARNGWRAHLAVLALCALPVILLHFPLRLAAGRLLPPLQTKAERQGGAGTEKQAGQRQQKQKKAGQKRQGPSEPKNAQREIARILRDLQFALEGGSAQWRALAN